MSLTYARPLLASVLPRWTDQKVIDRIVAETAGNPLALLELPRGMSPAELAGGPGFGGTAELPGRIEDSFARRLELLPEPTRRLLLLAAADPAGDAALLWRACALAGIEAEAAGPAEDAGLVQVEARVRFVHPLARALAAAQAWHQAGGHDRAVELAEVAEAGPLGELGRAQAEWLRAQIIFVRTDGRDGMVQLLRAAQRLDPLDRDRPGRLMSTRCGQPTCPLTCWRRGGGCGRCPCPSRRMPPSCCCTVMACSSPKGSSTGSTSWPGPSTRS